MTARSHIVIADVTYQAVAAAAQAVSYSPDHITRLARAGKVPAVQLDHRWYVRPDALRSYATVQQLEQQVRRKHLRQQRQDEQQLFTATHRVSPQRSLVSEYQVAAGVLGLLCFSVLVGAHVLVPAGALPAAALVAVADEPADTSPAALPARFASQPEVVYVTADRAVAHPAQQAAWVPHRQVVPIYVYE